jgi:hypothetical protein
MANSCHCSSIRFVALEHSCPLRSLTRSKRTKLVRFDRESIACFIDWFVFHIMSEYVPISS